jgi:aflatoxin B1 aldehyde reductase
LQHFLGKFYADRYLNDGVQSATATALAKAEEHGISGHAAALRWCAYHSALKAGNGDAIIIGASSVAQLESNLDMIDQGPLPEDVAAVMGAVYKQVELADAEIAYHW